ncbi:hypothetical protein BURMUCGD2M_6164 [Burkholderia multivorans CGD2M]|uniref:Uncharacterized protein n=1 Tax=Burkholderia multivorans CGD2 TaxID=513052 RepID=B9BWT8_9BURK|nr:hypothetical protein BURMUCGD2_6175 [Burkholderia multivorans CGD2]EEE13444.1 hypothetical protein BURMUCGD2M_6164 [Burkholderia multivorans CGD2M]
MPNAVAGCRVARCATVRAPSARRRAAPRVAVGTFRCRHASGRRPSIHFH